MKLTIVVRDGRVKSVNEFVYLGRYVKLREGTKADLLCGIKKSWEVFSKGEDSVVGKKCRQTSNGSCSIKV